MITEWQLLGPDLAPRRAVDKNNITSHRPGHLNASKQGYSKQEVPAWIRRLGTPHAVSKAHLFRSWFFFFGRRERWHWFNTMIGVCLTFWAHCLLPDCREFAGAWLVTLHSVISVSSRPRPVSWQWEDHCFDFHKTNKLTTSSGIYWDTNSSSQSWSQKRQIEESEDCKWCY